jgi:hypothetical protein
MSLGVKSLLYFFAFRNNGQKERNGDASNGSFQAKALKVQPQKERSSFVRSPLAVGHSKGGTKCYGATPLCVLLFFALEYLAGHASDNNTHSTREKGGSRENRHSRLTSPRVAAACAQRQQPPPRELNKRVEAPSGCIPKGFRTIQRHSRQRAACPLPPRHVSLNEALIVTSTVAEFRDME